MSTPQSDLELLRRFEPVIRYTKGEHFFPMDVEPYVRSCSLWVHRPGQQAVCLAPPGELTLERLAQPNPSEFGAVYFLKTTDPLSLTELASDSLKKVFSGDKSDAFHAGQGRLARVGYISRLVDAVFSLTLLARGRVPGDTAAAAIRAYDHLLADRPETDRYCYYGRVIYQDGWIALQYWFFYLFNNWRSGFFGVNDHESDWEMIYVYLSTSKSGEIRPEWVAYASHDYSGDDLRRRWDDPEVEKVGDHPVIYAGAGSHASYFRRGEYLVELELLFMAPYGPRGRQNAEFLAQHPAPVRRRRRNAKRQIQYFLHSFCGLRPGGWFEYWTGSTKRVGYSTPAESGASLGR